MLVRANTSNFRNSGYFIKTVPVMARFFQRGPHEKELSNFFGYSGFDVVNGL